jgi:hypothetical protein
MTYYQDPPEWTEEDWREWIVASEDEEVLREAYRLQAEQATREQER